MTKKAKIITISSAISLVAALVISGSLVAYFTFLHHYKGKNVVYNWSQSDDFSTARIKTVKKDKNKDFVILNLADVQMCDLEDIPHMDIIHREITYLVEQTKPDLITLTGDQTWSNENLISLTNLIKWLEGYKIPFAPVFGNHDYGNNFSSAVAGLNYSCDLYEGSKYCLFDRGPTNIDSLGNYAINIEEDNKIVKTLYMVDYGYNYKITKEQVSYFNWLSEAIKVSNSGEYASNMIFMHKPIPEFFESSSSVFEESIFDNFKDKNLTDVVCGHLHDLNETTTYEGVNFTFACKTGELVYYYDDGITNINGGTTFIINSSGQVTIENHYVDRDQFHIDGSHNVGD